MISASFAAALHLKPGDTLATQAAGLAALTVTGVYAVPSSADLTSAYWLDGACSDFSFEHSCTSAPAPPAPRPRRLTRCSPTPPRSAAPPGVQGQAAAWWVLNTGNVQASDLGTLSSAVSGFLNDPALQAADDTAASSIPQLTAQVTSDWTTLDVPVFLITGQLLLLAWLLLFLIATDAAEARAGEVALARLRGYGRARTVAFGISEPALLLLSFPLGAVAGWAFTGVLGEVLLRPGTPTVLPWLGIAAAAAAMIGGLVAVLAAAAAR